MQGFGNAQVMKKHLSTLHKELDPTVKCEKCQQLCLLLNQDIQDGKVTIATLGEIKEHIKALHKEIVTVRPA
jgi:D-serine deaminase-like pyridoxal phosphate-dependent protein